MAGKQSAKNLSKREGLERTDNGMKQTSWPEPIPINQKNYYTEYQKRDDQALTVRLQHEANRDKMIRMAKDRDRAMANGDGAEVEDVTVTEGLDSSKIIVIHPGSQNLRIGFASDALPKTIPMTIAQRYPMTEAEEHGMRPKRQKLDVPPEQQFGEEFTKTFATMTNDLKVEIRASKNRVLPNSKELIVNYNRRATPEKIPAHNDSEQIEWTDVTKENANGSAAYVTGLAALRIPDDSVPKYKVFRPLQHGWFHENDYASRAMMLDDFEAIIESALRNELGLKSSVSWEEYSCVFVIPDLYDKRYVEEMLQICLSNINFKQVAFIQETLAATFGSNVTNACVVDIGAQKTSISCAEEGMVLEDSRVNLKYGGYDVTEMFVKMLLHDHFPYAEINLNRRCDFLLAEELKAEHCNMNLNVGVKTGHFHLRQSEQQTRKYIFRTYDQVILAPMGFFDPAIFDNSEKLNGRRKWIDRSYNAYDPNDPDDPTSAAQHAVLESIKPSLVPAVAPQLNGNSELATPSKEKLNPLNFLRNDAENGTSRVTSAAASPAPEGTSTPIPAASIALGANGTNGNSPAPVIQFGNSNGNLAPPGMFVDPSARTRKDLAIARDEVLPIIPLDTAIITSITHASGQDEKKLRDFFGGITLIGGGAKIPGLNIYLEEKLKLKRPDLADKILVGTNPKDMDGQVVVWKGASVFGRLEAHESWVNSAEFERLGSRALHYKVLWHWSTNQ